MWNQATLFSEGFSKRRAPDRYFLKYSGKRQRSKAEGRVTA